MTEIVIDKKKYVLITETEYQVMQKKAALKTKSEKETIQHPIHPLKNPTSQPIKLIAA